MGNLREFVKKTVVEIIEEKYPQAKQPACLLALVMSGKQLADYNEYMVRVLDVSGAASREYPEIPVRSGETYAAGDTVVLANMDGLAKPYIIGRWYG